MELEEDFYLCDICEKRFHDKKTMKNHVRRIHMYLEVNNHLCEYCSRVFNFKEYIIRHIEEYHLKDKKCNCNHCNKSFYNKSYLQKHIQVTHETKKKLFFNKFRWLQNGLGHPVHISPARK